MKFYRRVNNNVCFLLPTVACGWDVDGRFFFEFGWLFFVAGIGDAP